VLIPVAEITSVVAVLEVDAVNLFSNSKQIQFNYLDLFESINMKKLLVLATLASLAFGASISAQAANAISTQELIQDCKGEEGTFVTCEIYGQAVYDTYLVTRHPKSAPDFICVQQPAPTRKDIIQEYITWSDAHPKYATDPAADTILRFLAGRFPCGKSAK